MNLSTVALLLFAWQMFGSQNTQKQDFADFLSPDTKGILDCVSQLSRNDATNSDKMGAILQMMSNPMFADLTSKMFGGKKEQADAPPPEANEFTNDEGYKFEQPSAASQEFFRPIEHIADAEIKHKLYNFYDNWYVT